jgi:hypothetical protein
MSIPEVFAKPLAHGPAAATLPLTLVADPVSLR